MLINNWYVAAESAALSSTPLEVRMLGCDFVLFRDQAGKISCLSAICCHRGASLAKGKVNGDCVECPYHGWLFDGAGQCQLIPALGEDGKIPKRARVDNYPVKEMFGWVWVFLGDASEEDRIPFHTEDLFPEYFDNENWHYIRLTSDMPVNWQRSNENAIDGAHPSFVHSSFGSRSHPKLQLVDVEHDDWSASTTRERTPPDRNLKKGRMREITPEKRGKTRTSLAFHMCGITNRTDIRRSGGMNGMHQVQLAARTPIDEFNTRLFFIQARNYMLEEEYSKERMEGLLRALEEDVTIVSQIKPPMSPKIASEELLVESDQLESAFRKKVLELNDKGWEIDSEKVERDRARHMYVIPCPDRAMDPKNWVHKPVPTTKPGSDVTTLDSITPAAE